MITDTATYAVGPFVSVVVTREDPELGTVWEGICDCEEFDPRTGNLCEHLVAAIHHDRSSRESDIVDVPVRLLESSDDGGAD